MTEREWASSTRPDEMIFHLAARKCTLDFSIFMDELFDRVRPEVTDSVILRLLDQGPDDGTLEDLESRIDELTAESDDPAAERQLQIAQAVNVFHGHGFAETMLELTTALADVSHDPIAEAKWQADKIRSLYRYDYRPSSDL